MSKSQSNGKITGGPEVAPLDKQGMDLGLFLQFAITTVLHALIWLPVYAYRCLVEAFVKSYRPFFGRILNHVDSWYEEGNCVDNVPYNSLVFTLILEGIIELKELRQLFIRNVLQAKISDRKTDEEDYLRYPQLTQHQAKFGGFTFWRNEDYFDITQHITERSFTGSCPSIATLHEEMINKKYPRNKSPWDITLIRKYQNEPSKTLLIFRGHHSMGDTLSWVKLLVECLGEKSLQMPRVQYSNTSLLEQIRYYASLPFYFVYVQVLAKLTLLKSDSSPWLRDYQKKGKCSQQNVSISKNILLSDIKTIAKENNVTTSAVVMAGVMGGVGKSDGRLANGCLPVRWMMPRMGHPDTLANHHYSRILELPTDTTSPLERLRKCNDIILHLKSSTLAQVDQSVWFQHGTWFNPFRFKFLTPTYAPLILTNIATDGEGFQVGSVPCSDFTMTSGATRAIICAVSYKDAINITTTVVDSILSKRQTDELTQLIENEFAILKNASS